MARPWKQQERISYNQATTDDISVFATLEPVCGTELQAIKSKPTGKEGREDASFLVGVPLNEEATKGATERGGSPPAGPLARGPAEMIGLMWHNPGVAHPGESLLSRFREGAVGSIDVLV